MYNNTYPYSRASVRNCPYTGYTPNYTINTDYTPNYTINTDYTPNYTFSTDPVIKFYGNYTIDSVIYPMSNPWVERPKCYQVIYEGIYEPEQTEQATQTEQDTTINNQVTVDDIPEDDQVVLNEDAQDLITN